MNKQDLINKVAEVLRTKKDAHTAVDCMIETITDSLYHGHPVTLVGFGTFKVVQRKGRKGRNPKTGEDVNIPAKTVPKFMPGKALKDAVA